MIEYPRCTHAALSERREREQQPEPGDPMLRLMLDDPALRMRADQIDHEIVEAQALMIDRSDAVFVYHEPLLTLYGENGLVVHVRKNADDRCGAVVIDLFESRAVQEYADLPLRYEYVNPAAALVTAHVDFGPQIDATKRQDARAELTDRFSRPRLYSDQTGSWHFKPADSHGALEMGRWSEFRRARQRSDSNRAELASAKAVDITA